jgi:hypothetical protein
LWVDFDGFLREPADALRSILGALGDCAGAHEIGAILGSPIMRQYSKAPEHPYDAALRRQVLESAEREHAVEIRRGMAWLREVALGHPCIQTLLT